MEEVVLSLVEEVVGTEAGGVFSEEAVIMVTQVGREAFSRVEVEGTTIREAMDSSTIITTTTIREEDTVSSITTTTKEEDTSTTTTIIIKEEDTVSSTITTETTVIKEDMDTQTTTMGGRANTLVVLGGHTECLRQ